MLNFIIVPHFFENRLYISPLRQEEIKEAVFDSGKELVGAGVRSYTEIVGILLLLFGWAVAINVDRKMIYINKKSFSKFVVRSMELKGKQFLNPKETAIRLHQIYLYHQKTGYNSFQLDCIEKRLNEELRKGEIKDFVAFFQRLKSDCSH